MNQQRANEYFQTWKRNEKIYGKDSVWTTSAKEMWWYYEQRWIDTNLEHAHGL